MAPNESDDFRWGRIVTELKQISEHIKETREGGRRAGERVQKLHEEVTQGFSTVKNEITQVGTRLESHIDEDNRRFTEQNERIDRVVDVTIDELKAGAKAGSTRNIAKPVAAVGGTGVLVAIIEFLRVYFKIDLGD